MLVSFVCASTDITLMCQWVHTDFYLYKNSILRVRTYTIIVWPDRTQQNTLPSLLCFHHKLEDVLDSLDYQLLLMFLQACIHQSFLMLKVEVVLPILLLLFQPSVCSSMFIFPVFFCTFFIIITTSFFLWCSNLSSKN